MLCFFITSELQFELCQSFWNVTNGEGNAGSPFELLTDRKLLSIFVVGDDDILGDDVKLVVVDAVQVIRVHRVLEKKTPMIELDD